MGIAILCLVDVSHIQNCPSYSRFAFANGVKHPGHSRSATDPSHKALWQKTVRQGGPLLRRLKSPRMLLEPDPIAVKIARDERSGLERREQERTSGGPLSGDAHPDPQILLSTAAAQCPAQPMAC